jgi:hypothetical protein
VFGPGNTRAVTLGGRVTARAQLWGELRAHGVWGDSRSPGGIEGTDGLPHEVPGAALAAAAERRLQNLSGGAVLLGGGLAK